MVSRWTNRVVAGLLFSTSLAGAVQGQTLAEGTGPSPTNQVVAGRSIGFTPRYGRVHPAPPRRPLAANVVGSPGLPVAGNAALRSTAGARPSGVVRAGATSLAPAAAENIATEPAGSYVTGACANGDCLGTGSLGCADGGCADGGCYAGDCGVVGLPGACCQPMLWGGAEYLYWWTDGMHVPALATTSPTGTAQATAGVLGNVGTTTLFGGNTINDGGRAGGRYRLGAWLDPCQSTGIEFSYLVLGGEDTSFSATTPATGILARPFLDVAAGTQDSRLIVFPNLVNGNLAIRSSTDFQTGEALLRRVSSSCHWSTLDYFYGYRYANLEDQVNITESTTSLAAPTTGTTFDLSDRFQTENIFHGGQIGVRATRQSNPLWSIEMLGKFSLGNTRSRTSIRGGTTVTTAAGDSSSQNAGLLAQGTNIGEFESNQLSTIVECGATLRRHFTDQFALTFGYTFFLWTDVIRAGDQIDTGVNVSQIPPGTLTGAPRPAYTGTLDDFWAQGLRFGLELNY